jgi:hypothetical protein
MSWGGEEGERGRKINNGCVNGSDITPVLLFPDKNLDFCRGKAFLPQT